MGWRNTYLQKTLDAAKAYAAGVYQFAPTATKNLRAHRWRVRAEFGGEWQAYSEYADISYAPNRLISEPLEIVFGGMQYYLKVMDTTDSNMRGW
jgi:hypothetical protein